MDWMLTEERKKYLVLAVVAAGVYFALNYLSPLAGPFIPAFLFVAFMYPRLSRLQRRLHVKKGLLAAGLLFLICVFGGAAVWGLGVWAFRGLASFVGQMDAVGDKLEVFVHGCCDGLEKGLGIPSGDIENFVLERVDIFIENIQVEVVPRLMDSTMGWVKNAAGAVGFLVVMIIASILLTKDYPGIVGKLKERKELEGIFAVGRKVFSYVKTYLRAQVTILLIISILCAAVLCLSGIQGGIALGLLAGFLDMLPFIGTGIILLPLAFWQIVNGFYGRAAAVVVLYAACALTREFLEPRLIGKKAGLYPVFILLSVYAGLKLFGLSGVIKGPLMMVIVYETGLALFTRGAETGDPE